jgi:hypothetical protein
LQDDIGSQEKKWTTQHHYHLNCFQLLTRNEQEQLLSIVNKNNSVGENVKEELQQFLENKRGGNND